MPRIGRIDAPGAVHHVMGRGLEGREIFLDSRDCRRFVDRFGVVLGKSEARCLAWALLPNHYHLLVQTGKAPLARVMASLLTSYAVYFNRRHNRQGYLFQDRYKSILCEDNTYLLELVRYIHLNPIYAGIVDGLDGLSRYQWSGHRAILGLEDLPWLDVIEVRGCFGSSPPRAVEAYLSFLAAGIGNHHGLSPELEGILRREAGDWEFNSHRDPTDRLPEAVAGQSVLVNAALDADKAHELRRSQLRRAGWTPEKIVARAARLCRIATDLAYGPGKRPAQVRARALACKWLVEDLGLSEAKVAHILRIAGPTVSVQLERGRRIVGELGFRLEDVERGRRI